MAALWKFITLLPTLLEVYQKLSAAVDAGMKELNIVVQLKKMDDAEAKAKATKDTSDLQGLFDKKSNP